MEAVAGRTFGSAVVGPAIAVEVGVELQPVNRDVTAASSRARSLCGLEASVRGSARGRAGRWRRCGRRCAVGTYEVVRCVLYAEPGERLSAGVEEDAGCRFAGEAVHRDQSGVALAEVGELIVVPARGGSAARSGRLANARAGRSRAALRRQLRRRLGPASSRGSRRPGCRYSCPARPQGYARGPRRRRERRARRGSGRPAGDGAGNTCARRGRAIAACRR
jgi:hypothetical protein